ncbi:A24 family peptidase [Shewanella sp. NIFS-20-20]|uniref:prepilin peptidase n=1 Tax=Shewanella sp. NIFS-20-20 TaxID=2853806 RepID=UPI001C43A611|nr:A24 family peptidase [Shewanella sp. NIFS-20-20]MBV7316461.1 A24 family peptidase [Shewanella sp. NIFS-20-20]
MTEFIALMQQLPWLFYTLSFIFAATIGSFLNVIIHRLPVMMKREWQQECHDYLESHYQQQIDAKHLTPVLKHLAKSHDDYPDNYNVVVPASACPQCHSAIKPWQNLPVISWLLLKGKCHHCQHPISARYPIVEAITGLLVTSLAWHFGPTMAFIWASILTFGLIAMTWIDFDEMLLPDQLTLPLLWLGLLLNINGTFTDIVSAVIGAVAGYLSLWTVFWGFKLITGKEGMGYGDFKLMAVFGAWLGWQMLPLIILLSSLVGAVVGITLMATKRMQQGNPMPFGPYIALAGWIALLFGHQITQWYLASL